jgi:hypothetical protein
MVGALAAALGRREQVGALVRAAGDEETEDRRIRDRFLGHFDGCTTVQPPAGGRTPGGAAACRRAPAVAGTIARRRGASDMQLAVVSALVDLLCHPSVQSMPVHTPADIARALQAAYQARRPYGASSGPEIAVFNAIPASPRMSGKGGQPRAMTAVSARGQCQ